MTTSIGPMTNAIFDKIMSEFKRKEVKDTLMDTVVEPFMDDIWNKYSKYFVLLVILQITIIILLFVILSKISRT